MLSSTASRTCRKALGRGLALVPLTIGPPSAIGAPSYPQQLEFDGRQLRLQASAVKQMTFLKIDVYAVGLYVDESGTPRDVIDPQLRKVVRLTFLRDVSRSQLISGWLEDLGKSCDGDCPDLLAQAERLCQSLPDIQEGQSISYGLAPSRVEVAIDGQVLGTLRGDRASPSVLAAFLGESAPPALREALLDGLARSESGRGAKSTR